MPPWPLAPGRVILVLDVGHVAKLALHAFVEVVAESFWVTLALCSLLDLFLLPLLLFLNLILNNHW